jgi:hypothetical protein
MRCSQVCELGVNGGAVFKKMIKLLERKGARFGFSWEFGGRRISLALATVPRSFVKQEKPIAQN